MSRKREGKEGNRERKQGRNRKGLIIRKGTRNSTKIRRRKIVKKGIRK